MIASVKELNAFLKGEHMAIKSYEQFIEKAESEDLRQQLQRIQIDHKQHAIQIASRIQDIGGQPATDAGLSGMMAQTVNTIRGMGKIQASSILEDALSGENQGIQMAQEIVKGDLDPQSRLMIEAILDEDRKHLKQLDQLLNELH